MNNDLEDVTAIRRAETDLGELDRSGAAWRLRFVRHLAHSPERVWRALTEPAELEAWFPTTIEGERAAGAPLTFTFRHGEADAFEGRMIACEPPRLLEFMWGTDKIRFELEPVAARHPAHAVRHRRRERQGGARRGRLARVPGRARSFAR